MYCIFAFHSAACGFGKGSPTTITPRPRESLKLMPSERVPPITARSRAPLPFPVAIAVLYADRTESTADDEDGAIFSTELAVLDAGTDWLRCSRKIGLMALILSQRDLHFAEWSGRFQVARQVSK